MRNGNGHGAENIRGAKRFGEIVCGEQWHGGIRQNEQEQYTIANLFKKKPRRRRGLRITEVIAALATGIAGYQTRRWQWICHPARI
jgi:hypothetical protein